MTKSIETVLHCQRGVSHVGEFECPIFVGFLPAIELRRLSVAPAFKPSAENHEISASLRSDMSKWQRPLDEHRVVEIAAAFGPPKGTSASDIELMPNPVLLALKTSVEVNLKQTGKTGATISVSHSPNAAPFWILDGQHRIAGLAKSEQRENPLPFVLLMNEPGGDLVYDSAFFAKLFAQVTTKAEPLADVHAEWLGFAFDINDYAPTEKGFGARIAAMKATKALCEEKYKGQLTRNKIQFNPASKPRSQPFAWPNNAWVKLFMNHYFKVAKYPRGPKVVAEELHKALWALREAMKDPDHSSLFGPMNTKDSPGRKAFQEGVVEGLLRFLAEDQKKSPNFTNSWPAIAREIKMDSGDWNLGSKGGTEQGISRRIPRDVLIASLNGHLPSDLTIPDWLNCKGGTNVTLSAFMFGPGGYKSGKPTTKRITLKGVDPVELDPVEFEIGSSGKLEMALSKNLVGLRFLDRSRGDAAEPTASSSFKIEDIKKKGGKRQILIFAKGYLDRQVCAKMDLVEAKA